MAENKYELLAAKAAAGDPSAQKALRAIDNVISPSPGSSRQNVVAAAPTAVQRSPAERSAIRQRAMSPAPSQADLLRKRKLDDAVAARETEDWWQEKGRTRGEGIVGAPLAMAMNYFNKDKKTAARTKGSIDIARMKAEQGLQKTRAAQLAKGNAELYGIEDAENKAQRAAMVAANAKTQANANAAGKMSKATFHDPDDPAKPIEVYTDEAMQRFIQDGDGNRVPYNRTNLHPWYKPEGSTAGAKISAAQLKQDAETDIALSTVDPLINDFGAAFDDSTREQLYDATGGWTDWKALSTRMGLGSENDSDYQARQNIQKSLDSGLTTLVGGALEKFTGSKSDAELAEVKKGIADSTAEPLTYLSQIRRQVIPRLREIFRRGGKDTAESEAFLAELESRVTGWEEKFAIIGNPTAPDGQKLNKGVRSIKVVSE